MRWLGWALTAASIAAWQAPAFAQTSVPPAASTAPAAQTPTPAPTAIPAPTTQSYALSWVRGDGAEECPNSRWLAKEVERRLGRPVFDIDAERSIEVEVLLLGGQYRSEMYVRDGSGHVLGHRSLQGDEPGCAALANAVALAIALVIDPEALSRQQKPASSSAEFETPRPPDPPPPPAPAAAPVAAVCPKPAPPPAPPASSRPASFTRTFFSFRGWLGAGFVPAVAPGAELGFEARGAQHLGLEVASTFVPARPVDQGAGSLDIGLTGARVLLTYELLGSQRANLSVGAGLTLAALHVGVRAPLPVIAPGDYWYSAGNLGLKLQVPVSAHVFAETGLVGQVPFVTQQFLVANQSDPVWSQSVVAGAGFAGVGLLFP